MDAAQIVEWIAEQLANPRGCYGYLVTAERAALFVLGAFVGARALMGLRRSPDRERLIRALFFLLPSLMALCALLAPGRPLLTPSLIDPGSYLTRAVVAALPPWPRRLFEPVVVCFMVLIHLFSRQPGGNKATVLFWLVLGLTLVESAAASIVLQDVLYLAMPSTLAVILHAAMVQVLFFLLLRLCATDLLGREAQSRTPPTASVAERRATIVLLLTGAFAAGIVLVEGGRWIYTRPPLAGAHYYSWFPENWAGHYSAGKFIPPVAPLLGEYSSDDPSVFEQHVEWARQAGLRYFIFDWWPRRKDIRRRVKRSVEQLSGSDFRFAIHYEALDLKEPKDEVPALESNNVLIMTSARAERLKKHWELIARSYMSEPNYLRIDSRPVLFIYATRHLVGSVREAVLDARHHVYQRTGLRLFLVADEAFYNVLDFDSRRGVRMLPELEPNWDRLSAFDAVTCYNPYDPMRPEHGNGGPGKELFLKDVERVYRRYYAVASTLGVAFVPGVVPGYDDRALRPAQGHYALSRPGAQDWAESLFERSLNALVLPFADKGRLFFTVTSWNEWNEGTQVEPAAALASESAVAAGSVLQPPSFSGYLLQHVSELRAFVDGQRLIKKER